MSISFNWIVFISSENTISTSGLNFTHGTTNEPDETEAKSVRNCVLAAAILHRPRQVLRRFFNFIIPFIYSLIKYGIVLKLPF